MNEATEASDQKTDSGQSKNPEKATQRPAFAKDYPTNATIDTLLEAFEKGNYAYVRSTSEKIIASSDDAEEKMAAKELLLRLRPDPLAVKLLLGAICLLFLLTVWTFTTHHH